MNNDVDAAIERLNSHAWGTTGMNSPDVLSDVLLKAEQGHSIDWERIRSVVLDDLQFLNESLRKDNPDERQPALVSLKMTYSVSKIVSLLLEVAPKLGHQDSSKVYSFATDISKAWYCVLSCDIANVIEGF